MKYQVLSDVVTHLIGEAPCCNGDAQKSPELLIDSTSWP